MATTGLRIGIVGCGSAAMRHADRLLAMDGVTIVGCADADLALAQTLAAHIPAPIEAVPAFESHTELLRQCSPDALVISSPDRSHYRSAMDGLQAGCHLLLASSLSTNVQEAVDIVGLARARDLKVCVDHGFRRQASLIRAREMLAGEAIGPLHLITSTLGAIWIFDPRPESGGILAELGIDWVDALLWTAGHSAELVSAIQSRLEDGRDLVTTASIRLDGGILASIAISGSSHSSFELEMVFHGQSGRLRATGGCLTLETGDGESQPIPLPESAGDDMIDFVAVVQGGASPCCPASEALEAVRVLEAIARSAAIGQFVGLG